jgi:hypothetical protein
MKTQRENFLSALGFCVALTVGAANASGTDTAKSPDTTAFKQPTAAKPAKTTVCEKQATQLLTGSHIPTTAKRMGRTADTPYPIYIIDGKEIQRSGAGSISEALWRCPAVR